MARRRMGAHGSVNTWTDGSIKMTIRPEPVTLEATDVASIVGSTLLSEIVYDGNYYSEDLSYRETMNRIIEQKLTKTDILDRLSDYYYLGQWEMGSETMIYLQPDEYQSHQAVLDFILMKFPKFRREDA